MTSRGAQHCSKPRAEGRAAKKFQFSGHVICLKLPLHMSSSRSRCRDTGEGGPKRVPVLCHAVGCDVCSPRGFPRTRLSLGMFDRLSDRCQPMDLYGQSFSWFWGLPTAERCEEAVLAVFSRRLSSEPIADSSVRSRHDRLHLFQPLRDLKPRNPQRACARKQSNP